MKLRSGLATTAALAWVTTSTMAAVVNLPDSLSLGSNGSSYTVVNSLDTTLSNDPAVYLVGTMTFNPDASIGTWDSAQFYNGTAERGGFGKTWQSASIGITGGTTVPSGLTLDLTQGVTNTFLMVLKVNQTNGALTLWVNPNLNALEANNSAQATATLANQGTYTNVRFRGGANTNDVDYTDFAVYYGGSTPFVPEPATVMLFIIGGIPLLRRRRA